MTIVVFVLMLFSPIVGWLGGVNVQLDEQRLLSPMPELSIKELRDRTFFRSFDRFFDDHFAFRVDLIKAKNWIDYYVFKTSPSPNVHIGVQGWFYLQESANDFFKLYGCKPEEIERMNRIAKQIHDLKTLIESSGRQFILIVAPNKETIYPENYGLKIPVSGPCRKSHYDLFLESLETYPIRHFVRLDELLLDSKKEEIYYRTDTHWNFLGGKIVSEAILNYIAPLDGAGYMPRVNFETRLRVRDLSRMMGLDIREAGLEIKEATYPTQVHNKIMEGLYPGRERIRYISTAPSGKTLLPRTILYRDSFANLLVPYMKGAFDQLEVVWFQNENGELILRPMQPEILKISKIVIFEVVERFLPDLVIDLPAWEMILREETIINLEALMAEPISFGLKHSCREVGTKGNENRV